MGAIRSDRPDRIVEVACDLFSRHGFSLVAYSDIARALNTSKAAIYCWYRAKQDMLAAVVAPSSTPSTNSSTPPSRARPTSC